ncbi:MAG TPA: calcium/sodium antiporter [Longimicrobiales bacterium]|nr:calcium/sodium antiporter [Longimicrobiales bacterium]
MTLFFLVAGLALLVLGAEWLVKGASGLAAAAGVSSLVIGLTVVALGTSAPEMSVSVVSALHGKPDLAVGNVVGSNILNVLLILGVSAVIMPLAVQRQLIRLDVPIMIGVSVLVYLLVLDGMLGRLEAGLLCVGLFGYMAFQVMLGLRHEGAPAGGDPKKGPGGAAPEGSAVAPPPRRPWPVDVALVLVGLALLVLGSRWFVESAVTLARAFGMSELLIGLTLVALGTSLPEVATSIMASVKGERDIAVGNVVGSNIFNLLGVLGLSGAVAPAGLPVSAGVRGFDLPVMIAVALACLPVFLSDRVISRWEGWHFLAYYAAYTVYIFLAASHHESAPLFGGVMMVFVIPMTAVTLGVIYFRSVRDERIRDRAAG